MRVPSIGLPLDERLIVREAYRMAERMLADYRDPPGLVETIAIYARRVSQSLTSTFRILLRGY